MFPNSDKPSLAPLLIRLSGGVISFERQANEQLRPAQLRHRWAAASSARARSSVSVTK